MIWEDICCVADNELADRIQMDREEWFAFELCGKFADLMNGFMAAYGDFLISVGNRLKGEG